MPGVTLPTRVPTDLLWCRECDWTGYEDRLVPVCGCDREEFEHLEGPPCTGPVRMGCPECWSEVVEHPEAGSDPERYDELSRDCASEEAAWED